MNLQSRGSTRITCHATRAVTTQPPSLFLDPQSASLYHQPPSIFHRHNCVPASPRHLLASYNSTFVTFSVQQPSAAAPTIATSTTTTTGSVQSIRFAGDWVHTFPTAHHIAHRGATWKRDLLSTAHYQATGLIHQHQAGGRDLGVGRGSRGLPESPVGVRLVLLPGAGQEVCFNSGGSHRTLWFCPDRAFAPPPSPGLDSRGLPESLGGGCVGLFFPGSLLPRLVGPVPCLSSVAVLYLTVPVRNRTESRLLFTFETKAGEGGILCSVAFHAHGGFHFPSTLCVMWMWMDVAGRLSPWVQVHLESQLLMFCSPNDRAALPFRNHRPRTANRRQWPRPPTKST